MAWHECPFHTGHRLEKRASRRAACRPLAVVSPTGRRIAHWPSYRPLAVVSRPIVTYPRL